MKTVKESVKKEKPVYIPKPIKPEVAINDQIDKFYTEDYER